MGANALSFLASAGAVASLARDLPAAAAAPARPRCELLLAGVAVRRKPIFIYLLWLGGVASGLWVLTMWVCLPLVVQRQHVAGFRAVRDRRRRGRHDGRLRRRQRGGQPAGQQHLTVRRPVALILLGNAIVGLGLLSMAAICAAASGDHVASLLVLAAAAFAVGGPLSDVPMATLRQTEFLPHEVAAVYRLAMVSDWGGTLVATLAGRAARGPCPGARDATLCNGHPRRGAHGLSCEERGREPRGRLPLSTKATPMTTRWILAAALAAVAGSATAATPDQVLLVINADSPASRTIGHDYRQQRGVNHVVKIHCIDSALSRDNETMPGTDYAAQVEAPIRVPEAARRHRLHRADQGRADPHRRRQDRRGVRLRRTAGIGRRRARRARLRQAPAQARSHSTTPACCVGSAWLNRYWNADEPFSHAKFGGYVVTRLDAFTVQQARELTHKAIAAEQQLGQGPILLDIEPDFGVDDPDTQPAPIPSPTITQESPYSTWNADLQHAANDLSARGVKVLLDTGENFVGGRTNLLGYWSWGSNDDHFSHAHYESLAFLPGAIGDTAVSTSALTMLPPGSDGQSAIGDLLAHGITGVKGYIDEPLLQAISSPTIALDRYTSGFSLGESFAAASHFVGWTDLIIGDPLAQPYPALGNAGDEQRCRPGGTDSVHALPREQPDAALGIEDVGARGVVDRVAVVGLARHLGVEHLELLRDGLGLRLVAAQREEARVEVRHVALEQRRGVARRVDGDEDDLQLARVGAERLGDAGEPGHRGRAGIGALRVAEEDGGDLALEVGQRAHLAVEVGQREIPRVLGTGQVDRAELVDRLGLRPAAAARQGERDDGGEREDAAAGDRHGLKSRSSGHARSGRPAAPRTAATGTGSRSGRSCARARRCSGARA